VSVCRTSLPHVISLVIPVLIAVRLGGHPDDGAPPEDLHG
jgi:hypothetical protein